MARQSVLRFLETAFRRWWLCIVPVALMVALAVMTIQGKDQSFESTAVVRAEDETLLARLSDERDAGVSFDTPSEIAARQINESMHTDQFVSDVLDRAGIELGAVPGLLTLADVRSAVTAWATGDNLLNVRASTVHPEASLRLTEATIDTFIQSVIKSTATESTAVQDFYAEFLPEYEQAVADAEQALNEYAIAHPELSADGDRPIGEQLEIERLSSALTQAEARLSTATDNIEAAELAIESTRADVAQRLQVIDAPVEAGAPESTRREDVMTLALYITIGLTLSAIMIGLLTVLDHSLYNAADVRSRLGADVLASVPEVRPRHRTPTLAPSVPDVAAGSTSAAT